MLTDDISQTMRELYEATEEQFKLEIALGLKDRKNRTELLNRLRKVKEQSDQLLNIVTERASKLTDINPKPITDKNERMSKLLVNSAISSFIKAQTSVTRLSKTMSLSEAIFKQTQIGIDKALPIKVNGKNYGYKEYMEMNVRTTIQQEIGEQQLKAGEKGKVVFYIANVFGDSADDHADWQGKIYYDERYKSFGLSNIDEISKFIRQEKLRSVQWVRDKPVYLTTRPNCRHTLTPISIQQAMNVEPNTLLNALNLKRGTYKDEKYKQTQEQRYNERMIRKYKARAEANEKLGYDNTQDRLLVKRWQARQRRLVKANPELERDYRRETRKVLLNDLGAKFQ
jgi:hypothetical protein